MKIDVQELNVGTAAIGPAGHGVFMDAPQGQAEIGSNGVNVTFTLNEKSLSNAVSRTGVKDVLQPGSKLSQVTAKYDEAYAASVEKRSGAALTKSIPSARSHKYRILSPEMNRGITASPAMGPIARANKRRLYKLRHTFNQIASRPKQNKQIPLESLPTALLQKMAENDRQNGRKPVINVKTRADHAKEYAAAWSKWDAVGALDGVISTPRPKV